jgi:hypothetical protein
MLIGLSESASHTVRDSGEKIKASYKGATHLFTDHVSLTGLAIVKGMEPLLTSLIEHKNQEHVPLLTQVVQAKAPTIYEMIKHGGSDESLKHSMDFLLSI